MKESKGDRVFLTTNAVLLTIITIVVLYPLYFIAIASFSDPSAIALGEVILWPVDVTLESYQYVLEEDRIWKGYLVSIIVTLVGTLYNLALTIPAAYVLSKKELPFRNTLSWYFFITMYLSGGLIPTYLVYVNLGLVDTLWALILGSGVTCYNLIVSRQYFTNSIPDEVYEAAEIDGASQMKMFTNIAVPLATSIIAIMALFYGVGFWNDYYKALIYIKDADLYPLQLVLRSILILNESLLDLNVTDDDALMDAIRRAEVAQSMKYSLIIIGSVPLLIAYPFVQKHFVKGVMMGSLKG